MKLTQILQPECVKVPLESKDKDSAIVELVDLLDAAELLSDRDAALEAVVAREKMRSTGIGSGIAIPHGKCKAVKELVMAIGITTTLPRTTPAIRLAVLNPISILRSTFL